MINYDFCNCIRVEIHVVNTRLYLVVYALHDFEYVLNADAYAFIKNAHTAATCTLSHTDVYTNEYMKVNTMVSTMIQVFRESILTIAQF